MHTARIDILRPLQANYRLTRKAERFADVSRRLCSARRDDFVFADNGGCTPGSCSSTSVAAAPEAASDDDGSGGDSADPEPDLRPRTRSRKNTVHTALHLKDSEIETTKGFNITAISYEGLSITLANGEPATLAVVDKNGKVIETGTDIMREVWNVSIAAYRNFLMGSGHLRVHSGPPGSSST